MQPRARLAPLLLACAACSAEKPRVRDAPVVGEVGRWDRLAGPALGPDENARPRVTLASGGRSLLLATDRAVYRSDDHGASWDRLTGEYTNPGLADLAASGDVLVGAPLNQASGLLVSTDEGSRWGHLAPRAVSGRAFDSFLYATGRPEDVLSVKHDGQRFLAQSRDRAWSSVDGVAWQALDPCKPLGRPCSFQSIAGAGGTLWALEEHGLVRSTDGGATFEATERSPSRDETGDFAVAAAAGFACVASVQVACSTDGGATWQAVPGSPQLASPTSPTGYVRLFEVAAGELFVGAASGVFAMRDPAAGLAEVPGSAGLDGQDAAASEHYVFVAATAREGGVVVLRKRVR